MVAVAALAGALGLNCAQWSAMWPITSCPDHFVRKLNLASVEGFDAETCCEATCAAYTTCPDGFTLVPEPDSKIGSDSAACCQAVHRFFLSAEQFVIVGLLSVIGVGSYRYRYVEAKFAHSDKKLNGLTREKRQPNKFRKSVTFVSEDDVSEIPRWTSPLMSPTKSPTNDDMNVDVVDSVDSVTSRDSSTSLSSVDDISGLSFKEAKKVRARRIPSNDDFDVGVATASTPSDFRQQAEFEPSEIGEWYDIWTRRSAKDPRNISRSASENTVLLHAINEAERKKQNVMCEEIQEAQRRKRHAVSAEDSEKLKRHAQCVVDLHSDFNERGRPGRWNRARTAICITADKQPSMHETLSALNLPVLRESDDEEDQEDHEDSQHEALDATDEFRGSPQDAIEWFKAHPSDTRVLMVFSDADNKWYKNSPDNISDFVPLDFQAV